MNKLLEERDKFGENVTDIGAKTQFLETMLNRLEKNANNLEAKMARLTGTDMSDEFIHKSTNAAVTNALYQMGSTVIPLSLMDFIR